MESRFVVYFAALTSDGQRNLHHHEGHIPADAFTLVDWPRQSEDEPRQVYVHVLSTCVRTLYRAQVVIVRPALDAPASATRYWASSDLDADLATLLGHISARWDVENTQSHYPHTMHRSAERAA